MAQVRFVKTRQLLAQHPDVGYKALMQKKDELGAVKLGKAFYWREDCLERASEQVRQQAVGGPR